jgi:hypothetical protein
MQKAMRPCIGICKILYTLTALLCMAGCATQAPRPTIVRVVSDNYCRLTEAQTYDASLDTLKTIDEVRRSEQRRVCLCVKPKPKACG